MAEHLVVPRYYNDAEELLESEKLDFIDIIKDTDTHEKFTLLGTKYGLDAELKISTITPEGAEK